MSNIHEARMARAAASKLPSIELTIPKNPLKRFAVVNRLGQI